jgi:hypothetical protein
LAAVKRVRKQWFLEKDFAGLRKTSFQGDPQELDQA